MPIRKGCDPLLFNSDPGRIWTEIDLVADIVKIPSKRMTVRIDGDLCEVGFIT